MALEELYKILREELANLKIDSKNKY